MRAFRLTAPHLDGLRRSDEPVPELAQNEVLVKMRAASLNYKDGFYLNGEEGIQLPRATIPLSDGAGEVVAVGPLVRRFAVGDRVVGNFVQDWIYGPIPAHAVDSSTTLGHGIDGVLAEFRTFHEEGLVRLPQNLTYEEAATLPCAAVTAWNAVRNVRAWETVLITGTGGVALFALQFASALGAKTIIISSSDEKLARAKHVGADHVVNYKNDPDWHLRARELTGGRGVEHVVDAVGPDTLERSIAATAREGTVHFVGLMNPKGALNPMLILGGTVNLRGVRVGSRKLFEEMNAFIERHDIHPVIGKRFAFEYSREAFEQQVRGAPFGKIVIDIAGDRHA
ncbi:NAD(P)-dependent alcohol dehydrogenase [Rhizobium sp. 57MFTsu3.2]|uniref:zinc-dependent alcohol dehydrogenase family protein n=1 Tax=Rhizobium sp. 57MFTsu3.2 TaxID=1048681 RepID=UPI00146B6C70|nr:NAD(P)-dependent alcohol dehydrogenase [Rhizobium sp. 57MFTsu3.2]NMN73979.1 NADPH:quinone reductase-like Zn-dependent oxidoreductase [Rhizobium sp. 57MFTsu3.2]